MGTRRGISVLETRLTGDPGARSLLPVQSLHSIGETMFAVSLAGSLFLNVSVDAARPRIVLYLALTFAPFVVLGPLIGPFIDRIGGGHRTMLLIALAGRAIAAIILANQIRSVLFYPLAFVMIVLAKVFTVSRNALVPVLVRDRDHLVLVNARLARTASVAGMAAAPVAVLALSSGGGGMVLRLGAIAYALGGIATWWIPRLQPVPLGATSRIVESTEMSSPAITAATVVMAAMRAAVGFTLFHVGFAMKSSGAPTWVFGVLAGASAAGTFLGTFAAPRVRRHWGEPTMLTASLVLPLAAGVVAALRFHPVTVGMLTFALGLGASMARRGFDGAVQTEAPHAKRGQAFAGLETRLELSWVVGALIAVATRSEGWMGITGLSAALGLLVVDRTLRRRTVARIEAVSHTTTLPIRLLETAEAVHARGDTQQAVVVAMAAVDAASDTGRPVGPRSEELHRLAHLVAADEDEAAATEALALAHDLVAQALVGRSSTEVP
jgi:MFS family permease